MQDGLNNLIIHEAQNVVKMYERIIKRMVLYSVGVQNKSSMNKHGMFRIALFEPDSSFNVR